MKKQQYIWIVFFSLLMATGYSQEKSKKELRAEKKMEQQGQIEVLVNSKAFTFKAVTALPMGMSPKTLDISRSTVDFTPDNIESDLPFYGRAYSGLGLDRDPGMTFSGTPIDYTLKKKKKNYQISMEVEGDTDTYTLDLSVGFEGAAMLTISSGNRGDISYQGEIIALKKE